MSVAGLWHGASLNFILWGFLNGLILYVEKIIGKSFNIPSLIKIIFTCFIVFNLWMVFRINEFSQLITFNVEFYSNLKRLFMLDNLLVLSILITGVISQNLTIFIK